MCPIYISINLFKILIQTSFILGKGVIGLNFPGCPATFQQEFQPFGQGQFSQDQSRSQKFTDEHQRVHSFKQGDVVALPAGIVHWSYNDGDAPIVAVYVFDVNNNANQLEPIQKVTIDVF
jgi:hypothetical protein